ncbi:hypothetical protein F5I97DRAFT_90061 [Phlebopus sp. FC_14]|nr:hypothetical protein F5I97DRAFT_90061 [Phlebopus sp. FC_14]
MLGGSPQVHLNPSDAHGHLVGSIDGFWCLAIAWHKNQKCVGCSYLCHGGHAVLTRPSGSEWFVLPKRAPLPNFFHPTKAMLRGRNNPESRTMLTLVFVTERQDAAIDLSSSQPCSGYMRRDSVRPESTNTASAHVRLVVEESVCSAVSLGAYVVPSIKRPALAARSGKVTRQEWRFWLQPKKRQHTYLWFKHTINGTLNRISVRF